MAGAGGLRVLPIRCDALGTTTQSAVDDLLAHFDPDVVYIIRDNLDMRIVSRFRRTADVPVIGAGRSSQSVQTATDGGVTLAVVDDIELLDGAGSADADSLPPDVDFVISDKIEPETDPVSLDATLAREELLRRYQTATETETTFCTGAKPANYEYVWQTAHEGEEVRLPIHGLGPIPRSGTPELACLTLAPGGDVAVSSVPADRFGLQAISGVGPTQLDRLTSNGYDSRAAIAEASTRELANLQGIGEATATTMQQSAQAIAENQIVRTTAASVPANSRNPVFVDIETDGLNPTIIWLIGLYDSGTETYRDFLDSEPSLSDPGHATREFVSWLAAEYDTVSLITWNGYEFDYPHLRQFIAQYAPEFLDYWDDAVYTYDLYHWAEENAVLPGRTNRLEDVAAALGAARESSAAGIDGATLARTIRRNLHSPERADSIDWDQARAYCEADVRELASVYDAIADATPGRERATTSDDSTEQTGLGEFSS